MRCAVVGGVLSLWLAAGAALAGQEASEKGQDTRAEDEKLLRALGLGVDGPALLAYFRKHTLPEADPGKLAELIRDLGDEDFQVREKAFARLQALGGRAMAALKQAEASAQAEVSRRAAELKRLVEAKSEPAVQAATARLLARLAPRQVPAGASEVILNYLPFAADSAVLEELVKTLSAVGIVQGKVDAALLRALGDKRPLQRGVAAQVLAGAKLELPAIRKLLQDAEAGIRLRVALALVRLKEKEALPVLVDVLAYLPPEQLGPAEDILVRLAGDKAPAVSLGTSEAGRKTCRDAWAAWLNLNKDKIDLSKVDPGRTMLGYTLVVQLRHNPFGGIGNTQIVELDAAFKQRWSFEVPGQVAAAVMVGPKRVLLAEYQSLQISERDLKGNIVWQKAVPGNPIGVQRLANGHTFVVLAQSRLLEYNAKGEEVYNFQGPPMYLARKLANGEIVFLNRFGQLTRLDSKTQRTIKTFQVGPAGTFFGCFALLPNGHFLIPLFNAGRVVEFDRNGKQVGNPIQVLSPNGVVRMANGHYLVCSMNTGQITEFDRAGRRLRSQRMEGRIFNIRHR